MIALTRSTRLALAALIALTLAVLTACGGGAGSPSEADAAKKPSASRAPLAEVKPASAPKAITGPSTSSLTDAAVPPVMNNPAAKLPATVTSHDQSGAKQVVVKDTSRVVALSISGSLSATVWGLGKGSTLVGRDQSTTFPGAKDLPVVTSGGHSVNAESVLATRPTLVITDGSIGPRDVIEQLRDAGVTVVFVKNDASFAGAAQLAKDVAAVYGVPAAGEKLAAKISADVKATKADVAKLAPRERDKKLRIIFLYVRGNAGVYYLFGSESGADDLIEGLGGIDVAAEQGWKGMRPMTDEAITRANPDLVLVMSGGLKSAGGVDGLLTTKNALALTNAGKNKRFVDMADGDILGFGPRSAHVLDALARAVYAPKAS